MAWTTWVPNESTWSKKNPLMEKKEKIEIKFKPKNPSLNVPYGNTGCEVFKGGIRN